MKQHWPPAVAAAAAAAAAAVSAGDASGVGAGAGGAGKGGGAAARLALLTYATGVPPHWLLGRSAALHGVPLVLAGLGRRVHAWCIPGACLVHAWCIPGAYLMHDAICTLLWLHSLWLHSPGAGRVSASRHRRHGARCRYYCEQLLTMTLRTMALLWLYLLWLYSLWFYSL